MISEHNIGPNITKTCDHLSIDFQINIEKIQSKPIVSKRLNYDNKSLLKLNEMLFNTDWDTLTENCHDIYQVYETIVEKYNVLHDSCISMTEIKSNHKPFNNSIRDLIKKRSIFKRYNHKKVNFNYKYSQMKGIIGKHIEIYETLKLNKLIEKSNNLNTLYKHIKCLNQTPGK